MTDILPGAEPYSRAGGAVGVLFVHGFTGSPSSMRTMAVAAADAGHTVALPRLAGHGTSMDDLETKDWPDWTADVEAAYLELRDRVSSVVVVALSAGGAWSSWLALRHAEIAGLMMINPLVMAFEVDLLSQIHDALASGISIAPGDGPDIAKVGADEVAYEGTPLRPLLRLNDAIAELATELGSISQPVLIATSAEDHVVHPRNSDHLAGEVGGPVRRLALDRSFHVATQDHDQDLLIESMLDFIKEVTS